MSVQKKSAERSVLSRLSRNVVSYFPLAFILAFSLFYLSPGLSGLGLNLPYQDDEGIYLYSAWRISGGELPYLDFFLPQAPLSHLLMGYIFRLTGASLFVARLGSVLAISLTAILLYKVCNLIVNSISGVIFGVIASLLFLFHPLTFMLGRLFMPESFMILFYCAGAYLVVKSLKTKRDSLLFPAGVMFGLSAASKMFGVFSLMCLVVFFMIQSVRAPSQAKKNLKSITLTALGFLAGVIFVSGMLSFNTSNLYYCLVGHHAEKGTSSVHQIALVLGGFLKKSRNGFIFTLSIIFFVWFIASRKSERLYLCMNLLLPGFFFLSRTVFAERHLFLMVPFLCLMSASLMGLLWQKKVFGKIVASIFIFLSFPLYFSPSLARNSRFRNIKTKADNLIEYVQETTKEEDYVFCDYPAINFLVKRKLPPRLVDVSSTSTATGVLDCNEIVSQLEGYNTRLLLLRIGPLHHIRALNKYRKKVEYERFMSYVASFYDFEKLLSGAGARFEVYSRKEARPCRILPPFEAESLIGDGGIAIIDFGASAQMAKYSPGGAAPKEIINDSFLKLPPGKYSLFAGIKVSGLGGSEEIASLEIISEDNKPIAERTFRTEDFSLSDGYQYQLLEFRLNKKQEPYVRFRTSGKQALWLDNFVLSLPDREVDRKYLIDNLYWDMKDTTTKLYECEKLYHKTGSRKTREDASGFEVIHYSFGDDPPGTLVYGPYERYPEGEYTVTFSLRIKNSLGNEEILKLDVVSQTPDGKFLRKAERLLKREDFLAENTFQDFSLDFLSDGYHHKLEFRIEVYGKADVEADKITVSPKSDPSLTYCASPLPLRSSIATKLAESNL